MKKSLAIIFSLVYIAIDARPVNSMLGADGTELQEEWEPTAMDYVQDGLVAHWDGIENVGYGLHDENATVWTDITGNGWNLTLNSSAISRGRFKWTEDGLWHVGYNFDIIPSFSVSDVIGATGRPPFSISILVKIDRYNSMKRYVPFGLNDGCFGFYWIDVNTFYAYLPWGTGVGVMYFDDILNTEIEFTIVSDGTSMSLYHDGVLFKSAKCGDYSSVITKPFVFFNSLGNNPTFDNSWICTLKKAQIYNKVLTDSEIRHNYYIDKMRFGL